MTLALTGLLGIYVFYANFISGWTRQQKSFHLPLQYRPYMRLEDVSMSEHVYTILVVDDSKPILTLFERTLRDSPYHVITVDSAVKAYELVERQHIDIVITDIVMPEMDGLTLLRKIKNFNGMIQVIIMTGYITINNTLDAFRYGAVDIFFKPIEDMQDVVKAVQAIVEKLNRINAIIGKIAQQKRKLS